MGPGPAKNLCGQLAARHRSDNPFFARTFVKGIQLDAVRQLQQLRGLTTVPTKP